MLLHVIRLQIYPKFYGSLDYDSDISSTGLAVSATDTIYLHYPFLFDINTDIDKVTSQERKKYDFMGKAAMARFQMDPEHCYKRTDPRIIIGLSPRNAYTEEIVA